MYVNEMVLIQAEYFLHFAQNFLEDISFLVIFEWVCRTFIPTENRRNSSLHFQIFPATELYYYYYYYYFLWAKMLLIHLIVFSHNKSVSVFLSLYGQNRRNSSLHFQIFPATELYYYYYYYYFLWAKMLLIHLIVFSHNKSVSVFLSLYGQKPSIPNLGLQRKRKKNEMLVICSLDCRKSKHLRRLGGGGDGRAGVG